MNDIWPITSSYNAVFPKITFSKFTKYESSYTYSLQNNCFFIVIFIDGANQLPLIKGFCNTSGVAIDISISGISYRYSRTFYTIPEGVFGFKLIDINGRNLFTPWSIIKDGYCEFGFSVNSNYVTLNGITF